MPRGSVLTQETFDGLLAWLATDRAQAGRRYEDIRRRLIEIFTCRGCHEAEDLADETITRVAFKVPEIAPDYEGDKARYFYGVAQKVLLEYYRRKPRPVAPPPPTAPDELEQADACLAQCIARLLNHNEHRLILDYYREGEQRKIDHRQELAARLGIELSVLRLRVHRLRRRLLPCVEDCLAARAA